MDTTCLWLFGLEKQTRFMFSGLSVPKILNQVVATINSVAMEATSRSRKVSACRRGNYFYTEKFSVDFSKENYSFRKYNPSHRYLPGTCRNRFQWSCRHRGE